MQDIKSNLFYGQNFINVFNLARLVQIMRSYDYLSINDYSKMFTGEKKVPIVFSSMVSGQRALDKYSYIRLKNRIKEIYDDIKK